MRLYNVTLHSYCGMAVGIGRALDRDGALEMARGYLAARRREGYTVAKIGNGEWEVSEPEDAAGIPDDAGVVVIRRITSRRHNGRS